MTLPTQVPQCAHRCHGTLRYWVGSRRKCRGNNTQTAVTSGAGVGSVKLAIAGAGGDCQSDEAHSNPGSKYQARAPASANALTLRRPSATTDVPDPLGPWRASRAPLGDYTE